MEQKIKSLFNDQIVSAACTKYGIPIDELTFIGGFQNFVYEYQLSNHQYILRFTHSSLRSKDLLAAELEWILYIADHGVSVSRPVCSLQGNLVEQIEIGDSCFRVSSFEKAQGKRIGYPDCLKDVELYEQCGMITGQMHRLAKSYKPHTKRHAWHQNYYLQNVTRFIPSSQSGVLESCKALMDRLKHLDADINTYGLIHGDINVGNFLVDNGKLTLFDFDEAQYSWFVEDIAIQLYYLVYVYGDDSMEDRQLQCQRFMEHFLKGYVKENSISENELKLIPLFLRLREIIVYTGMYRSFDMSNLDDWTKDYLTQSKARIENGISIIESYF
ncbi:MULTISPECIES: phosphotransferase enzyme family protein [Paenibacillus]|uniref:phosphotransferase enzyme family protein n=1 Tax=Paenibacillus TaxID=44249 RepID=UPI0004F7EAB5|nr:phosphotransferase [Paenibacillus odorifer]AIQ74988.1 aminoglycoside phosphotransferase [Paenibacillus odorifer]MEC0133284.1 phosphotransferase [Paenibacillus odorifer]MEC0221169.1 phosphotransferase [Paenibacillus odorifer]OME32747.1 aminoglycoside phosphotransferase [Paenibacillus odorifer]OME51607.1 aminoglycoside phosphotransferase [Paenibacillus odorifer]